MVKLIKKLSMVVILALIISVLFACEPARVVPVYPQPEYFNVIYIDDPDNQELEPYTETVRKNANAKKRDLNVKRSENEQSIKVGYAQIYWTLDGVRYDFNTPVVQDITLQAYWEKGISIRNQRDLMYLNLDIDNIYHLTSDITLEEEWVPSGLTIENAHKPAAIVPFRGALYGHGYSIKQMQIDLSRYTDFYLSNGYYIGIGLFAVNEGIIDGIKLENINIFSSDPSGEAFISKMNVGGIAGVNVWYGSSGNMGNITNCIVSGNISFVSSFKATDETNDSHIGGIVGINYANLSNCFVNVTIDSIFNTLGRVGGITGKSTTNISNCFVKANIVIQNISNDIYYSNGKMDAIMTYVDNVKQDNCFIVSNSTVDETYEGSTLYNNGNLVAKDSRYKPLEDFYTNFIGLDETVWRFTEGALPQLIKG